MQITGHRSFIAVLMGGMLLLTSCKKESIQYTFRGNVNESVHSAGLADVDVNIAQKTYDGTVASTFFNAAGSDMTDAIGQYQVAFDREKVVEFKFELFKEGYFDYEEIVPSGEVTSDEPNVYNFIMEPKSWITFNLFNFGASGSDEFTMVHYNFREDCSGCTTNDYYYYYGAVDSSFTYTTTGGVYTKYSYKAPGASVYIQDSVYTTLFDTVVVDIDF